MSPIIVYKLCNRSESTHVLPEDRKKGKRNTEEERKDKGTHENYEPRRFLCSVWFTRIVGFSLFEIGTPPKGTHSVPRSVWSRPRHPRLCVGERSDPYPFPARPTVLSTLILSRPLVVWTKGDVET